MDRKRRRKPWLEPLEPRLPLTGIVNGFFDVASAGNPDQFGWQTLGAIRVDNAQAVLAESVDTRTELAQSFELPVGAERLTLELVDAVLNVNAQNLPDAFEIALLDANTLQPLLGVAGKLANTDALLNINADGQVFYGAQVTVPGAGASGDAANLTYPLAIEIDLSGLPAGTLATLAMDLLGAGALDAVVTVDNVRLRGNLAPPLTLAIDPATDSGTPGDEFTSFVTVTLVGTTDPGQEVLLDLDGDGPDDGSVTADGQGRFRFDSVTLAAGGNAIAVEVTNSIGTTAVTRTFRLDNQPVTAALLAPAPGALLDEDPGFVLLEWTDEGDSQVADESFDTSDVSITGVTVDRVEDLGDGQVRYWYSDDGDALPYGRIDVTRTAGAVTDRAGNGNAESTDTIAHLQTTCTWTNPVMREDINRDGFVTPLDALVVINRLNAMGSGSLPVPPTIGFIPPPFFDTNCDDVAAPLDALIVINYLNEK